MLLRLNTSTPRFCLRMGGKFSNHTDATALIIGQSRVMVKKHVIEIVMMSHSFIQEFCIKNNLVDRVVSCTGSSSAPVDSYDQIDK
jgi:hypothetical protein